MLVGKCNSFSEVVSAVLLETIRTCKYNDNKIICSMKNIKNTNKQ